jgi:response regulator RpfG family c-di-GMP phosphodiesterase
MTGVEFLQHTMNIFPDAKRILLTDYADTDAVMRSINKVKIDYYLTKPGIRWKNIFIQFSMIYLTIGGLPSDLRLKVLRL